MVEIVFNKSVHKDLHGKISKEVSYYLEFCSESFFDDAFWGKLLEYREESAYFYWHKTINIPREGLFILEFEIFAEPTPNAVDDEPQIPKYEITGISCRKA